MNRDLDLPFRFDVVEGRALLDWLNRDGVKDLFKMEKYPIRWGLLGKVAYRKGYTKEKTSETIGNLISALKNNFSSFQSSPGKENRSVNCIISNELDNMIIDIWFNHIKKRPYHTIVIDLALYNGFITMNQMQIPINPDNALTWSRYLNNTITFSDVQNDLKIKARRIDDEI